MKSVKRILWVRDTWKLTKFVNHVKYYLVPVKNLCKSKKVVTRKSVGQNKDLSPQEFSWLVLESFSNDLPQLPLRHELAKQCNLTENNEFYPPSMSWQKSHCQDLMLDFVLEVIYGHSLHLPMNEVVPDDR